MDFGIVLTVGDGLASGGGDLRGDSFVRPVFRFAWPELVFSFEPKFPFTLAGISVGCLLFVFVPAGVATGAGVAIVTG